MPHLSTGNYGNIISSNTTPLYMQVTMVTSLAATLCHTSLQVTMSPPLGLPALFVYQLMTYEWSCLWNGWSPPHASIGTVAMDTADLRLGGKVAGNFTQSLGFLSAFHSRHHILVDYTMDTIAYESYNDYVCMEATI